MKRASNNRWGMSAHGPALVSVALLSLVSALCPAALDATSSISLSSMSAHAGQTVQLPVNLAAATDVAGINLRLQYDPAVLTARRVERGVLLDNSQIVWDHVPAAGRINVLAYSVDPAPFPARFGDVLTISFDVAEDAAPGEYAIDLAADPLGRFPASGLADLHGTRLAHIVTPGSVLVVLPETATPTDTPTDTPTGTLAPTDTPTDTPSATPTPTNTPTDTATGVPSPVATPTDTAQTPPTETETPGALPTRTPTETRADTPTGTLAPTGTPTDTATGAPTQVETPADTPTGVATETPGTQTPAPPDIAPPGRPDGVVDQADLMLLLEALGSGAAEPDLDGDGDCDYADLMTIARWWKWRAD